MSALGNPALAAWLEVHQRERANETEQRTKPGIGEGLSRGPSNSHLRGGLHDGDWARWSFPSRLRALVRGRRSGRIR